MGSSIALSLCLMSQLLAVVVTEPAPQFYPLFQGGHQQHFIPSHADTPAFTAPHNWNQPPRNLSGLPNFINPVSSAAAEELLRNHMPRQSYGAPPSSNAQGQPLYPGQGQPNYQGQSQPSFQGQRQPVYPQIYKVDNLIIIANPSQVQAQPCIPRRPIDLPDVSGDDITDRFGEPSKCTWAIVACCSPGSNNVRYNCFEVLGCPGLFFDNSPCEPKTVMAAAAAALDYYRSANNATSKGTRPGDTNNL